jgi:hypothetical protein
MRGHFRYLRFKTFLMTPRTLQCKVFWALLSSSEHSGVPEDSKSSTFPSVGLHPHTWPKWGCDTLHSREHVECSRVSHLARNLATPCLGREPKARVAIVLLQNAPTIHGHVAQYAFSGSDVVQSAPYHLPTLEVYVSPPTDTS